MEARKLAKGMEGIFNNHNGGEVPSAEDDQVIGEAEMGDAEGAAIGVPIEGVV